MSQSYKYVLVVLLVRGVETLGLSAGAIHPLVFSMIALTSVICGEVWWASGVAIQNTLSRTKCFRFVVA